MAESLVEDIADGDITAQLAEDLDTTAFCITREDMVYVVKSLLMKS